MRPFSSGIWIPGSHKEGLVEHHDTFDKDNLLSRGQEISNVKEEDAEFGPLLPGEISLHHGRCFHASGKNRSKNRRIGIAIRYVTPEVRDHAPGRDWAMPVRTKHGEIPRGGWDCISNIWSSFPSKWSFYRHPNDLMLYDRILSGQSKTLAEGARNQVKLYGS